MILAVSSITCQILFSCVETHDYEVEMFIDDLCDTEIFRVLLTMITGGAKRLTSYTNPVAKKEDNLQTRFMDADVFLLLQSLIVRSQWTHESLFLDGLYVGGR